MDKNAHLNIRLSENELTSIRERARSAGVSVSAYMRTRALNDQGRPIIRADSDTLRKLYRDLRHAGGNLNQCAHELNTHHRPSQVEDRLNEALEAVRASSDAVSDFLAETRSSI
ncbi:MAG: plasmid mobilization relaxosome protein MobC [Eggerthellaceae bacterium]|nr:plasmid mobilization relaxosome protein MobC [Eggerthellaceae bacterium]